MKAYFKVLLAGILGGMVGCGLDAPRLPPQPAAGVSMGPSVLVESYKISVGDAVQVNVWKNPELSIGELVCDIHGYSA